MKTRLEDKGERKETKTENSANESIAKKTRKNRGNIFQSDEMKLMRVHPCWTVEDLLKKECLFFLKDVLPLLNLSTLRVIAKVKELIAAGESPWGIMGVRKIWNHWAVRMKIFAPYYRVHLVQNYRSVLIDWDSNELLKQRGHFKLTEVCELLPFSSYQIRYQAKKNPSAKVEYGIWKDDFLLAYMVDMVPFSKWIKTYWSHPPELLHLK